MKRLLTLAVLASTVWAGAAAAQSTTPDRDPPPTTPEARKAIGQLKSPYCPGLMLEVCPSEPAMLLRDSIRTMAIEGASAEEIVEWMIANHGEEWRAVPRLAGWGIGAWVLPPLVLLLGLVVLIFYLRRRRGVAGPGQSRAEHDDDDPSSEDLARLETAMAAFEEESR